MLPDAITGIKEQILNTVDASKIYLFGSYARGTQTSQSDYDFFVDKGRINGLGYISFIQELEDNLHAHVDVVTFISDSSTYLKEAIDKEGVEIYAR